MSSGVQDHVSEHTQVRHARRLRAAIQPPACGRRASSTPGQGPILPLCPPGRDTRVFRHWPWCRFRWPHSMSLSRKIKSHRESRFQRRGKSHENIRPRRAISWAGSDRQGNQSRSSETGISCHCRCTLVWCSGMEQESGLRTGSPESDEPPIQWSGALPSYRRAAGRGRVERRTGPEATAWTGASGHWTAGGGREHRPSLSRSDSPGPGHFRHSSSSISRPPTTTANLRHHHPPSPPRVFDSQPRPNPDPHRHHHPPESETGSFPIGCLDAIANCL